MGLLLDGMVFPIPEKFGVCFKDYLGVVQLWRFNAFASADKLGFILKWFILTKIVNAVRSGLSEKTYQSH